MLRPQVTVVADAVYEALGPLTEPDPQHDYHLLHFVASVADLLQPVEDIVRDTDDGPGWSILLDVDRTARDALPFLAQFVGVQLPTGLNTSQRRQFIREAPGFARGTVKAIVGAIRPLLTGSQYVEVAERTTSAYAFTVRVFVGETPDEDAVLRAAQAAKPAGLSMSFIVSPGASYEEINHAFDTYRQLNDGFETYRAMTYYIPAVVTSGWNFGAWDSGAWDDSE